MALERAGRHRRRQRPVLCSPDAVSPEGERVIDHGNPGALFLGGPAVVLILLSGLSALALLAAVFGRAERLARLSERAAGRLDLGRGIPTLWGLAAGLFLVAVSGVLFSTKVVALLGVVTLILVLALASLGLGAAALSLGQRLTEAAGSFETETLPALRLGLWALFLVSFLPFLGWVCVLLAVASGIGAVLEMLAARRGTPVEKQEENKV